MEAAWQRSLGLRHQSRSVCAISGNEGIQRNKNYESIVTLGMRGDGDMPMAGSTDMKANMALLEKIVADQRTIIAEVHWAGSDQGAAGLGAL